MTPRDQSGWYSDEWQLSEQHTRKRRRSRDGADDGRCWCQHRWRRCLYPPGWDTAKKLSINSDDLWELQKIFDGKNGSLNKTCKCQAEANDTVWDLNWKTERALDTLANLYERFEQVNSDLAKVDKEFGRKSAHMQAEMERVKEAQRLV